MAGIIDAHSHYIPPEIASHTTFFKQYWSDLNRQLGLMDELGIEKACLFYPTTDAHLQMGGWQNVAEKYNSAIAQVVSKHPDRFIGAGILPVDDSLKMIAALKQFGDLGLKILSLGSSYGGKYLDDEKFFPVYEFCAKHSIPIHVHPQILNPIGVERVEDPLLTPVLEYVFDVSISIGKLLMGDFFVKFPDVKFIFAHYGGVIPFIKERFDNTYQMLRRRNYVKDLKALPSEYFKNLFFETSGSKSRGCLMTALEVVAPENVMFGSDFPANHDIPGSIASIQESDLKTEEKSAILNTSAQRLLIGC